VSIITGQATVPSNSTVPLFTVPAGLSNTTIYNLGTIPTYVGTSTALTTSNGMLVPTPPLDVSGYVGSKGATVFGTTGSATASTVNYLVSTAQ
jgi:hypothetical protein